MMMEDIGAETEGASAAMDSGNINDFKHLVWFLAAKTQLNKS